MAILVKPMQRINPLDKKAPRKWYVTRVTTTQADEAGVTMEFADETTSNPSEAMMAVHQLRKILLRRLLGSENVKLGNWGSFNVTLSNLRVPTKREVNAKNIRSVNLNFQPNEAFGTDLQKATFVWVDKLAEGRPGGFGGSDLESPGEIWVRVIAAGRYPGRYSCAPAQILAFCCSDTSGYPCGYALTLTHLRPYIYVSTSLYPHGYTDADTWVQEYSRMDTSKEDTG